ncbi:MAG: efflux RND transporter periplasmic adaptor subunit, partial [Tannerellaceae bacterium]|nr:efflux RND transporter periplasmic adaptor subunit [Tannerellaceae bacterium]
VSVRAAFPNQGRLLHSGGSGNVIIPQKRENCLVIPQLATVDIQDKVFAYKVVNGVAERVMVQVTPLSNGKEYIVETGLKEGDEIISEGVGLIRPGAPVQTKSSIQQ